MVPGMPSLWHLGTMHGWRGTKPASSSTPAMVPVYTPRLRRRAPESDGGQSGDQQVCGADAEGSQATCRFSGSNSAGPGRQLRQCAVAPHGRDAVVTHVVDQAEGQPRRIRAVRVDGVTFQVGVTVRHDEVVQRLSTDLAVQLIDVVADDRGTAYFLAVVDHEEGDIVVQEHCIVLMF